ncbi:unnamed protein product [Meganyctiphanes norvegica]|uniref:mRNA guanylyltransferase n=1 Tax=Meganyctiphanes norvegica TaxID=48144 RepID=A0AAV2RGJ4_MEGNR
MDSSRRGKHGDSQGEFHKKSMTGGFEGNYYGEEKNNYQTTTQKHHYSYQRDSYRNNASKNKEYYHNVNEKKLNKISGSQRGEYKCGQWKDCNGGLRVKYNGDPKDTYYISQGSITKGADKGQIKNGSGIYFVKSHAHPGENYNKGGSKSQEQKIDSRNIGYGTHQNYRDYSDKCSNSIYEPLHINSHNHNNNMYNDTLVYKNSKNARENYSSAKIHQAGGATHVGRNGSIGKRTEEELDLIQQFQQSMILEEQYTPDEANAINTKLLMKNSRSECERKAIDMEEISNVNQISDRSLLLEIQQRIKNIVGYTRYPGFPGCLPISLKHENISNLRKYPYKVSWKADGTRYMMLIDGAQKIYFIGSNFKSIYHVPRLEFRQKNDLTKHILDTLLDGELIIDVNQQTGVKVSRFLVFDAIRVDGRHIACENFHRRHEIVKTDIINPRNVAVNKGLLNTKEEPFTIQQKLFWDVSPQIVRQLLSKKFLDQVLHGTDGLIFHCNEGPYVSGRTDTVLKYKPIALASIDFRLKIVKYKKSRYGELYVGRSYEPFGDIEISKELENLDGKIIECSYTETGWLFLRHRTDRTYPNNYDTAISIWETICSPINERYLIDYMKKYC